MHHLTQQRWEPGPPLFVDAKITPCVIAAASDLALVIDKEGVIQNISISQGVDAYARWSNLIGRPWIDTIRADSRAKVEGVLKEARAGGVARAREINQRIEGADDVPMRFSAVLVDKEQRVVVMGRDLRPISDLQHQMLGAQQAMEREYGRLRQAETRYRVLFQVSSEGVLVTDAASLKVLEANAAAASLLAEPVLALQGRTLKELFEARSWPAVQALLATVEAGGRPADVQVDLPGTGRVVTVSASLFRQSSAQLLLLRLLPPGGVDQQSGARDARMLAALDALPDGFVVIDDDRRILCANSAFCELVQQSHESQVVGQPLERWLGRSGLDLNLMLANLREHHWIRNFPTIVRGEYGSSQEAVVSAVAAFDAKVPSIGLAIRQAPVRTAMLPVPGLPLLRSADQLRELVGRVSLKEIVRESSDMIERLYIEAALKVTDDNRALAAQLLGLSRQGLYSKLRRYGMGDLDPLE